MVENAIRISELSSFHKVGFSSVCESPRAQMAEEQHPSSTCPVCLGGFMSFEFDPWSSMVCGHLVHDLCFQGMREAQPRCPLESLKCPTCRSSSDDFGVAVADLLSTSRPVQVTHSEMLNRVY